MLGPEPETGSTLPLSDAEAVDRLCDQFVAAHRNGGQPRIEDYLARAPEGAEAQLLRDVIAEELDLLRKAGVVLDIEDYRQRFPDRLAVIDAAWEVAGSNQSDISISTNDSRSGHDTDLEPEALADEIPEQIGRYAIDRELGRGGFAVVYLAHDTELDRHVALKVPRRDRFRGERDIERFVAEARNAAGLEHPGIVRVHDVQRDADSVYIVQQFIPPGQDLAAFAESHRLSPREIAELLTEIAEAVGFAHQKGIYHRDLKPANILIDEEGRPHVADFGLALHVTRQHEHRGELAGSYPYMAPEQVRGEAHRLDGRTDIWALGVILYELLTGTRPFHGPDMAELIEEIEHRNPRPLRQIDPTVPSELSRICLACLAKRATDRYESTADLIEDLRHWLEADAAQQDKAVPAKEQVQPPDRPPPKIVPKGLRCFDAEDANFFLELLPGPLDRDGLPRSIRFWKTRIEETDSDATFSVGLIYGPSGCGKSSLVRAGLLPHLEAHVVSVYVEATPADTEVRLLKGLRRCCPELDGEATLVELVTTLRDHGTAGGKKVLIVLDQFEQWLHTHRADDQSQLVNALRQCDGGNVQALIMVRDDFYLGVNRFFQQLEVRLLEGHNQAMADLFDVSHAQYVLTAFGRAYGRLSDEELTSKEIAFLETAAAGLAQENKVVSVRLAVFAEMMKGKPWTVASLRDVGGTEGVGVTFLEETFAARTAPPNHRLYEEAIRKVLSALLPEQGSDIKGQMQPYQVLLKASEYEQRPDDFDTVLDILDREVRLITPTEPDEAGGESEAQDESAAKHYQLTHDYLVPSLRRWLRQKELESYSGRARVRLADRAALYRNKPEVQQLPPWWEYANILALTKRQDWTEAQQRMMSAAHRYYTTRSATLVVVAALLAWGGREMYCRFNASSLVNSLMKAEASNVAAIIDDLQWFVPWARDDLRDLAGGEPKTPGERKQQLHARLALVKSDETHVPPLLESLLAATPEYVNVIRGALRPYRAKIADQFWQELHGASIPPGRRFRAGMSLADYAPDSKQWTDDDHRFLAEQLVSFNPELQPILRQNLDPISEQCLSSLENLFEDAQSSQMQVGAANALKDFAGEDKKLVARLLTIANPQQYEILFPLIESSPDEATKSSLEKVARTLPPDDLSSVERVPFGRRRAGAGITLLRLGERESVLPTFDMTNDPEALTQFIHRCRDRGVRAEELLDCLRLAEQRAAASAGGSNNARRQSDRTRYALLLALGEYSLTDFPEAERELLLNTLADWYANDASSGVHGATGWLLRQWGRDEIVRNVDQTPVPYSPDREWFTLAIDTLPLSLTSQSAGNDTPESPSSGESTANEASSDSVNNPAVAPKKPVPRTLYMTFIIFPPGTYQLGCPPDEEGRFSQDFAPHRLTITRPFAVLDREVTWEWFNATGLWHHAAWEKKFNRELTSQMPAFGINWHESVAYCRWLTEQSGMNELDQCYVSPAELEKAKNGYPENWPVNLDRPGFRLLTAAEWEVACRAGVRPAYSFGGDTAWLSRYARYGHPRGSSRPVADLRPNLRGLFDIHGNLYEWCHDWSGADYLDGLTNPTGPDQGSFRVVRGGCWGVDAAYCRSSYRGYNDLSYRNESTGFRLALVPSSKSAGGGEKERAEAFDPSQAEPDGS